MKFKEITAEDLINKGVVGLPDTPGLSSAEMQAKFDELAKDVLVPKFNELIKELMVISGIESVTEELEDSNSSVPTGSAVARYVAENGGGTSGASKATDVSIDPIEGVTATNAQGALEEINAKTWTLVGSATGKTPITLPQTSWSECYVLVMFGTNPNVAIQFLITRQNVDEGSPNVFFGGLYTSATDFHSVQIQKNGFSVGLSSWNFKGTDIADTCSLKVYVK